MAYISASVGIAGRNRPTDVALIQQLLNLVDSSANLVIDGLIGKKTINAIAGFQELNLKMPRPDSRIDQQGKTLAALVKAANYKPNNSLSSRLGQVNQGRFVLLYNKQFHPLQGVNQTGLNNLLGNINRDNDVSDIRWAAYMLATTMHETDRKWLPIEEYGKGKGYEYGREVEVIDGTGKKHINVYYGRGYVQITWERNYKVLGRALGMGDSLHINPGKALDPAVAYSIMSYGMRNGLFTGKRLSDYISGASADYYNARRIINGLDKARLIQGYAETLEQLLRLTQSNVSKSDILVDCTPTANVCFA